LPSTTQAWDHVRCCEAIFFSRPVGKGCVFTKPSQTSF